MIITVMIMIINDDDKDDDSWLTIGCQGKIELRSTDSFFNFFPSRFQMPYIRKKLPQFNELL